MPPHTKPRPGLTAPQSSQPTTNVKATEFNTERVGRENSSLAQFWTTGFQPGL